MVSNTNTQYGQVRLALSEGMNKEELEPVQDASSICEQPSTQFEPIRQLADKLLLQMQTSGKPFMKVSRREYSFLENSIWVDRNGNIFEQYHLKDKNGVPNEGKKNKGYRGKDGYKEVWNLKSLQVDSDCPEMVRAKFHRDTDTLRKRLINFQELKKDIHSECLLIPETVIDAQNFKKQDVILQMMLKPRAYASRFLDKLSELGKLRVIRNVGQGLICMHKHEIAHLNVNTDHIVLMGPDNDDRKARLANFDLSRTFTPEDKTPYTVGDSYFADPNSVRNEAAGLEAAKIHDQFSFGITICEIFTKKLPRHNLSVLSKQEFQEWATIGLREWLTEDDLKAVPGFSELDEDIQYVIRACCIGSVEMRPYRLPEFVANIEKLINNSINPEVKPGGEYVFSNSIYAT